MRTRAERNGELRVCLAVDGFYAMGGTERQVVELAVELQARAVSVTVLSRWPLDAENPYVAELQEAGVPIVASGWRGRRGGRLRRLPYLRARVLAASSDGLAIERGLWRWQVARLKAMAGPGFVLHELPFFGVLSPAGRRALRALGVPLVLTALGRMEGVVPVVDIPQAVVTADGRPILEPPDAPVSWVPSMGSRLVEVPIPRPGNPRTGVITYGGRLVPGKGVDVLIRAMSVLPEDLELVIAGYGPERERLERLARSLGVRARFTGPLQAPEFLSLLGSTDVAAFPGLEGEGLPSFVVEALGSGVPVVGTDVGTVASALERGAGVVVRPGDPSALARAIRELIEGDLEERRALARRTFEQRFAAPRVVDRYVEHYEEARRRAGERLRGGAVSC